MPTAPGDSRWHPCWFICGVTISVKQPSTWNQETVPFRNPTLEKWYFLGWERACSKSAVQSTKVKKTCWICHIQSLVLCDLFLAFSLAFLFFLPPHIHKSRFRLYQQYTPATLRGIIIPMRTTIIFDLIYKSNTTWFWTDIFILKKGYAHLHKTSQTGLHSGETSMYVLWSSLKQLPIWVVKVQIFQSNRNVTDLWWWLLWKLTY